MIKLYNTLFHIKTSNISERMIVKTDSIYYGYFWQDNKPVIFFAYLNIFHSDECSYIGSLPHLVI